MSDAAKKALPALNARKLTIGIAACTITAFVVAAVWHHVLFSSVYKKVGYVRSGVVKSGDDAAASDDSSTVFAFNFIAVLTQAVIHNLVFVAMPAGTQARQYCVLVMGIYHWSAHVVAAAAKTGFRELQVFLLLESTFEALQFTMTGLILSLVHGKKKASVDESDKRR